jgi:hypothetical protein
MFMNVKVSCHNGLGLECSESGLRRRRDVGQGRRLLKQQLTKTLKLGHELSVVILKI